MLDTQNNYDSSWLIQLAKEQCPDDQDLAEKISEIETVFSKSKSYTYFINPENPNKPGSKWQFKENIELVDQKEGVIILDVLKGGSIGGIEFLNKI